MRAHLFSVRVGGDVGVDLQTGVPTSASGANGGHLPCPGAVDHSTWESRECCEVHLRLHRRHRKRTGSGAAATSDDTVAGAAVAAQAPRSGGPIVADARIGCGPAPMGVRDRGRGRCGVPCGRHIGMLGNRGEPIGGGRRGLGGSWRVSSCQIPRGGTAAETQAFAGARKLGKAENTGGFGESGINGGMPGGAENTGGFGDMGGIPGGLKGVRVEGGGRGRGGGSTCAGGFRTGERERDRERADPRECLWGIGIERGGW
jgi:hypothetical protein